MLKEELIAFEDEIVEIFNDGKLKSPVHLSGGNEKQVISIFDRIKKYDWVFSTYRSHYHALCHGVDREWLKEWILNNKSIHVMNSEHKLITSAIVGGTIPTAIGVAMGIKRNVEDNIIMVDTADMDSSKGILGRRTDDPHVWCFIGDMTAHTGIFWEALKYSHYHGLPITFVIEDNGLSTDTPTAEVWNKPNRDYFNQLAEMFPGRIVYYNYERRFPHYGTGKFVSKIWEETDVKSKGF